MNNYGDFFHVRADGQDIVFYLYFVEAPKVENDRQVSSRVSDQAKYFGVTGAQAVQLGREAAAFTKIKLSGAFTVYTRWKPALGNGRFKRYYAVVIVGHEDLAQLLVKNGLARIYGPRTPTPDGTDMDTYLGKLNELEREAKQLRLGRWKFLKG
jgi:endonuclease YncB( thermonuclease family)